MAAELMGTSHSREEKPFIESEWKWMHSKQLPECTWMWLLQTVVKGEIQSRRDDGHHCSLKPGMEIVCNRPHLLNGH